MSLDSLPAPGLWFVEHKKNVKSARHIMKISDIPEQWPLIHYAGYEDKICKEVSTYLEAHDSWSISQLVNVVLKTIAKEHADHKRENFPNAVIKSVEDLM